MFKYNAQENKLVEQPTIPEPDWEDYKMIKGNSGETYSRDMGNYERHLMSLRTIDCHESCKGKWKDGQLLEEKEIEIITARTWGYYEGNDKYGCSECCNGDRCDEDCKARYRGRRKECPFCNGAGFFKEVPTLAFKIGYCRPIPGTAKLPKSSEPVEQRTFTLKEVSGIVEEIVVAVQMRDIGFIKDNKEWRNWKAQEKSDKPTFNTTPEILKEYFKEKFNIDINSPSIK